MINLLIILSTYFVSFLDKPEKTAPQLSPRAVEQRDKWHIPTDGMDYPVSPMYMDSLRRMGVHIHHKSRWFNGVTCEMDETLAAKVKTLRFVTAVEMTRNSQPPIANSQRLTANSQQPIANSQQLIAYNLPPLHQAGFEGQGILMAVCDGGFTHADTLSCFRQKELQLGAFDFTDDEPLYGSGFYGADGRHGTQCLSTISAIRDGYYGAAVKAQYYLMRTEETLTESPKEMDNLVAALETADSLGVNIFSVSLGYYSFNHADWSIDPATLDGKTHRASRAATIAARKGMLICVAAGNEAVHPWRTIGVPADADSVLTVGAVGADSLIASFSSIGPSADGRIKPEVCAVGYGTCLVDSGGQIIQNNGTSFATPLIAGLAACLWSALPDENAMQIRERIIRSADRYYQPDTQEHRYGYGIPDAWKAYTMKREDGLGDRTTDMPAERPEKVIRGSQILIIRHGHIYNLSGQLVE